MLNTISPGFKRYLRLCVFHKVFRLLNQPFPVLFLPCLTPPYTILSPRISFEIPFAANSNVTLTTDFTIPITVDNGICPCPIPSLYTYRSSTMIELVLVEFSNTKY